MYDAERGKEPWWVQGGAGDQRACVRLCACLCLPVPVACRRVFDARHNFTERVPAGFQIPSGIFNVYLSYSSILTRISGLGCGLFHMGRAARNRVCSSCVPILDRLSLVSSPHKGAFVSRSSMGPCSLLVYQVILVSVPLCTPALLACCSARTLGAWALFLFARASALCSCSSLVLPLQPLSSLPLSSSPLLARLRSLLLLCFPCMCGRL